MAERRRHHRLPLAWIGQVLLYGLFALLIGVFSSWPAYRHLPPDQALIKVSFSHQGKPVSDCRSRDAEELAKLPPNMRAPHDLSARALAGHGRSRPGRRHGALRHVAAPSGLSRDGASAVYQRDAGARRARIASWCA